MIGVNEKVKVVSLIQCKDYGRECVYEAVKRSLTLLGGLERFTAPGRKVFLKFNLLLGSAPEKCVTTHPDVVYAVARMLKEFGCEVVMGDSPGSGLPYTEEVLRKSYVASGYYLVAEELDIPLNYDTSYVRVMAPEGVKVNRFSIIKPALEADDIIVVSKAKTHALTILSGATKNMFGVIPGLEKPTFHANYQTADEFAQVMLDLNELMKPRLQVMDAIVGMEGDGPHSGTPRKIGAVLASGDYNAIDVVTAKLMSFDPTEVSTIRAAVERGCLKDDFTDITVLGDSLQKLAVTDFKLPSTQTTNDKVLSVIRMIAPRILIDRCIGCMRCLRSCPVKAITPVEKKPLINYEMCIRCYCCHEMCDEHAIALERISNQR